MRAPSQPPELPPKRLGVVFSFAGPLLNIGEAMPTKPPLIVLPPTAEARPQAEAVDRYPHADRHSEAAEERLFSGAEAFRSRRSRGRASSSAKKPRGGLATCPTWQRRNTNGARCAKMDGNAKAIASNGNPISLTSSTRGF